MCWNFKGFFGGGIHIATEQALKTDRIYRYIPPNNLTSVNYETLIAYTNRSYATG